jgi:DNA-binding GntR family transcriptional regulator
VPKLSRISSSSATERAYNGIISLLLARELRPGERTSVNSLAARLGLGRTPVKEAITRLETEGVLTVSDRSGTEVNSIDPEQARQLLAIRSLLECFAAEEAVRNATNVEIERVRQLAEEMRAASLGRNADRAAARFVAANVEFHDIIVGAARNAYLARLYSLVQLQLQIVSYLISRGSNQQAAEQRQREHDAIVRAFAARNGAKLRAALKSHIRTTANSIVRPMPRTAAVASGRTNERIQRQNSR